MKKKLKGGLEGIIALIILTGIIIALIVAVIIPMVRGTVSTGDAATNKIDQLESTIEGDDDRS